jgi:hypothetical protein
LTEWNRFSFKDIADDMLLMFWDGRPDLAVELARHLQAYLRANDRGADRDRVPYFLVLAVLYDWDGLEAEIRDLLSRDFAFRYFPVNDVVLILGALTPSANGSRLVEFIDRYAALSQETSEKFYERQGLPNFLPDAQARLSPTWVVRARIVDDTLFTVFFDDEPLHNAEVLVRFLVAVGDVSDGAEGALRLKSKAALYQLQRLADPGRAAVVAEQARLYAEAACQGWRPRDAAHARRAWSALQIAETYAMAPSDSLDIDEDLQRTAREKPERLPFAIAAFAGNYRLMDALIGD